MSFVRDNQRKKDSCIQSACIPWAFAFCTSFAATFYTATQSHAFHMVFTAVIGLAIYQGVIAAARNAGKALYRTSITAICIESRVPCPKIVKAWQPSIRVLHNCSQGTSDSDSAISRSDQP